MPLNASWIDALFARMQLRYAQSFERNLAGMDIALVKADWANVLDGVSSKAIAYALVNLPLDWPPNAMQFHALCIRGAPERQTEPELLDAPPPDPARVAAELAKLREIQAAAKRGPRQWAIDLQHREKSGEHLSMIQRAIWRAAVRAPVDEPLQKGSHTFLDEELPPGMRKGPVDPEAVQRLEQHVRAKLGYGISERAPDADHIPGLT